MNLRVAVGLAMAMTVLLLSAATPLGAATPAAPGGPTNGCLAGTPQRAARVLVDDDAVLESVASVAGLQVATVVDGRVVPGFAEALLGVGDGWCSVEWFNTAAAQQLAGADGAAVAAAFASVAAMPYLGDVAVSDVTVAGTTVTLTTTGGRHGAVSAWTIMLDGLEVSAARFTTTGWAPHGPGGSAGGLEGITSLPGHTRTFTRTGDGRVVIDASVDDLLARSLRDRPQAVARAAAAAPGDDLAHTFPDGFTIKVSYGLSPYTADAGAATGVKQADRLRRILAGAVASYDDFLRWGVVNPFGNTSRTLAGQQTGLPEAAGYINVDSPLALVCLACTVLSDADAMEIHVALLFPEIAPLVTGYSYPDSEQFLNTVITVIGHEMVHSLQGGYADGTAAAQLGNAFVEGTARASETLHDDASHGYQRGSSLYVDSSTGCEGFDNGRGGWIAAQAAGPFNGHTYDACYFWWTYFAGHGPQGLTALLEAMPAALAGSAGDAAARNLRLLDLAAPDGDGALDLARWGAALTAGSDADGYTIPAGQTGTTLDWFALLTPAQRSSTLTTIEEVTVADGGVRAFTIADAGTITALPEGGEAFVFDLVQRQLVPTRATLGTSVTPYQILVIVAPTGAVDGYVSID